MNRRLLLSASALALLAGCASAPVPEDYAAEKPALDLKTYFNGPLTAHGLFTDRAGKVKRRFTVKLVGRWQGDVGTLEEDFLYSDGKTERRVWTLTALGDGRWRGTAADVVGEAAGEARGNALRWAYTTEDNDGEFRKLSRTTHASLRPNRPSAGGRLRARSCTKSARNIR